MANKRPPFETRNYPGTQSKGPAILIAVALVFATVAAAGVGFHYWYGCQDWSFATTCDLNKK